MRNLKRSRTETEPGNSQSGYQLITNSYCFLSRLGPYFNFYCRFQTEAKSYCNISIFCQKTNNNVTEGGSEDDGDKLCKLMDNVGVRLQCTPPLLST